MPIIQDPSNPGQGSIITRTIRILFGFTRKWIGPGSRVWLGFKLVFLFLKNPVDSVKLLNLENLKKFRLAMTEHDASKILFFSENYVKGSNDEETGGSPVCEVQPFSAVLLSNHDEDNLALIKKGTHFNASFYLENNPDVEETGMDPLEHYFYTGWREGRDPSADFNTKYYIRQYLGAASQVPLCPLVHYIAGGIEKGNNTNTNIRNAEELLSLVISKNAHRKIICVFSHDNYAAIVGGIQIHMQDEQEVFNKSGISYLQFYPNGHQRVSSLSLDFLVRINLDGQPLGSIRTDHFLKFGSVLRHAKSFEVIGGLVQHTLHWALNSIDRFLENLNPPMVIMWLHDYFTCCPQYTLLRNDREYCFKPDVNSNSCLICKYGRERKINHKLFLSFFNRHVRLFLTPSPVSRSLIIDDYPVLEHKVEITPLLKMSEIKKLPQKRINQITEHNYKIKIAFLGYPYPLKGWNTWKTLIESISLLDYNLYLFAIQNLRTKEKFIPVSTSRQNRDASINALWNNNIDILFLWSLVPETYSLLLFEALASGCFIITNPLSGNIARYVKEHHCGMVLDDETALIDFLNDIQTVKNQLMDYKVNRAVTCSISPDITTVSRFL